LLQRQAHRRDEIGAASHWFSEKDIRSSVFRERNGSIDERVEATAKTAAGDFFNGETIGSPDRRVDESGTLIIRDEPDLLIALIYVGCEALNESGLSCAEKATDHDVSGRHEKNFQRSRLNFQRSKFRIRREAAFNTLPPASY
jgi:hypothetical protein